MINILIILQYLYFIVVGSNVQRKPLQNILPKNDEGLDDKLYWLKECEGINYYIDSLIKLNNKSKFFSLRKFI